MMKRYDFEIDMMAMIPPARMVEASDGEFVEFEDAQALHEALTKLVECIEAIKAGRLYDYTSLDWQDWELLDQELTWARKALGGGE